MLAVMTPQHPVVKINTDVPRRTHDVVDASLIVQFNQILKFVEHVLILTEFIFTLLYISQYSFRPLGKITENNIMRKVRIED